MSQDEAKTSTGSQFFRNVVMLEGLNPEGRKVLPWFCLVSGAVMSGLAAEGVENAETDQMQAEVGLTELAKDSAQAKGQLVKEVRPLPGAYPDQKHEFITMTEYTPRYMKARRAELEHARQDGISNQTEFGTLLVPFGAMALFGLFHVARNAILKRTGTQAKSNQPSPSVG